MLESFTFLFEHMDILLLNTFPNLPKEVQPRFILRCISFFDCSFQLVFGNRGICTYASLYFGVAYFMVVCMFSVCYYLDVTCINSETKFWWRLHSFFKHLFCFVDIICDKNDIIFESKQKRIWFQLWKV